MGAIGYTIGFFSWLYFVSHLVPGAVIFQFESSISYSGILPSIIYSLLSVSHFLSSFGCLGFVMKHKSLMAMPCFVFYVVTGSVWGYAVFNASERVGYHSAWSLSGFTSMIITQLVWGITMLRSKGNLPNPRVSGTIGTLFVGSALIGAVFWLPVTYFGFFMWFGIMGWLFAISSAVTAILLIKSPKSPASPSTKPSLVSAG